MVLRRLAAVTTCSAALLLATPARAEAPEATVRTVAAGLAAQKPQVVWEALPPTYQRDVTGLVHDFARNLDPAVHAKMVAVATKAASVLRARRDLVLSSQLASGMTADRARAEQGWDAFVGMLDTLAHSELADLGALKSLDVGVFLRTTGSRLMEQAAAASRAAAEDPYATSFLAQLEGLKVEKVAGDGETATVRVTPAGRPSQDLRLVLREGRWVPEELASGWQGQMAAARTKIASLAGPEAAQSSSQMLLGLGVVDGLLDQLAAMKTPQELDAAFQGLLATFAASAQQTPSTAKTGPAAR
jgi:hypothetical protein